MTRRTTKCLWRKVGISLFAMGCAVLLLASGGKASGQTRGDFNGDGFDDLALGIPGEFSNDAGLVHVLYGTATGLSAVGHQLWYQDSFGVEDVSESNDGFGSSLAGGDFNGDGFDDLAVGVPREGIGAANLAGAVNVLYGTATGLSAVGDQLWHQDSTGVEGGPEPGDGFGLSLAVGDFNGDGLDDLAVGVPLEDIGAIVNAGAVNVLYGTELGLSAAGN